MQNKINIIKFSITNSSKNEIVDLVESKIAAKEKYLVHSVNPHLLLMALNDKSFNKILQGFSELFLDGIGLFLCSKILHGKNGFTERLTGTDLYPHLFNLANEKNYKILLWGGSPAAQIKINDKIKSDFKNINLVGNFNRNFGDIELIKNLVFKENPDMIFVGLGSPLQEEMALELFGSEGAKFIICVGSGLDYFSGSYKRAPILMQKVGLEWFYRLVTDFRRLWHRYLIGVPSFIFKIVLFRIREFR